jgi:hypothetical protein
LLARPQPRSVGEELIWLALRQFRVQLASVAVIVAGFAVLLAVTGPPMANMFASSMVGSCQGGPDQCGAYADEFLKQLYEGSGIASMSVTAIGGYWLIDLLGIVITLAAPALIGIFWGAPLIAGELEAGTHYLAWTQSITRTRWLAVKLTLTGLAAMAVTEALSLMQAWWATPISLAVARGACCSEMAMNQFSPLIFATHGIAPLGYAAFGFVLGVTAGLLVRRAVLAMALTLGVFTVLQVAMPLWVRPHLFTPNHTITTISSWGAVDVQAGAGTFSLIPEGFGEPEAWVLGTAGAVDAAGRAVTDLPPACAQAMQAAVSAKSGHSGLLDCLAIHGIRIAVTYQPASRYWAFQWAETAIYWALALALVAYCFWRLRRRLS